MEHHFNVNIAVRYGVTEAVMLNNLWYWVKKNEANGANYYDGNYWTYNSVKAFEKLFPYLTNKQIRTVLKHLIDEGLIKTGNYNKSEYDRTTWYSFTEKGLALMENSSCPVGQMELPETANGFATEGEPIPNNKHTDKNTDGKTHILAEFENLWAMYPKKQGKKDALKHYEKARKSGASYEEIEKGLCAYVDFIRATHKDIQYVKMGSSFFSQEAWRDEWGVSNDFRGSKEERTDIQGSVSRCGSNSGSEFRYPGKVVGLGEES